MLRLALGAVPGVSLHLGPPPQPFGHVRRGREPHQTKHSYVIASRQPARSPPRGRRVSVREGPALGGCAGDVEARGGVRPEEARDDYDRAGVTRPERRLLTEDSDVSARERFEGEYPHSTWHHGRAVEALRRGYAPSKYPTKQWPPEALLEVWCSLPRVALDCFKLDALTHDRSHGKRATTWTTHDPPAPRSWRPSSPAVALIANEPPAVDGEDVRDLNGCALDTAFSGSRVRDSSFVDAPTFTSVRVNLPAQGDALCRKERDRDRNNPQSQARSPP